MEVNEMTEKEMNTVKNIYRINNICFTGIRTEEQERNCQTVKNKSVLL